MDPLDHERMKHELEGVDALSLEVFHALMKMLHTHKRAFMRMLAEKGERFGQAAALRLVATHDGISQKELVEKLHLAAPTVSQMLQAIEKGGAIVRRPDEKDQRLTRVYLTEQGRETADRMRVLLADYINEAIAPLPEEDRRELVRLLGDLSSSMADASAHAHDAHEASSAEDMDEQARPEESRPA